jgi:acetoacetyl-CoA synthetase
VVSQYETAGVPSFESAPVPEGKLLWEPPAALLREARLTHYQGWLEERGLIAAHSYSELWNWSVEDPGRFWDSVWKYFEVKAHTPYEVALADSSMPGARWFPGATLNYAEHALSGLDPERVHVIAVDESGARRDLSGNELTTQVGAMAHHLRLAGVGPGDRVAAYLPNVPEALVGLLATASIGAIWSSCSPDFGERAVLDRFQQIEPKVLIAARSYRFGGREFDRTATVLGLVAGLPTLQEVVWVGQPPSTDAGAAPNHVSWERATSLESPPEFTPVLFDHPLWVLYSSGTTGLPKPIVHGHGGILLEHLKALGLHSDLGPGDRFFWFTTTGWMMWNYLVSGLLLGATVVLYDGSPSHPGASRLWELVSELGVTHFGTSAGHIGAGMKAGIRPGADLDLSGLRVLGSTGSPLSPDAFAWVYRQVKQDLWLTSISGGTDVCTAFVLGCPWLPVRAGVIQCRGLGAAVFAFDRNGRPLTDEVGELVITAPLPSMPVSLWGDRDGSRYRDSYFSVYLGIWRHGDWVKVREDGGVVMYGRSDSTINRHGIRMGTAEIYRAVEDLPEVMDSLVVDVPAPGGDTFMPLFLVLGPGAELDDDLVARVKAKVRDQVSPRHVPDLVLQVQEVPKTLSGKKLEVPVKRILSGEDPDRALSRESLQNPAALEPFLELARRASEWLPGA